MYDVRVAISRGGGLLFLNIIFPIDPDDLLSNPSFGQQRKPLKENRFMN